MIDLHVHTTLSSGEQTPAAAMRFAKAAGYRAIAFTDHADATNMQHILESMLPMIRTYSLYSGIDLYAGIELTHIPPQLIPDTITEARSMGAQLVCVHGQTIADIVDEGTNLAAIEGGADYLAHPGLITEQEALLAAEKKVYLEVTARPEHALTNGHLVKVAELTGAPLILNNGGYRGYDFINKDRRRAIALGAGMSKDQYQQTENNSRMIVSKMMML
ncbi:histidinol phosphate phosphatase domain-containing protein [Halodesulfovibrio sp.]|jgi:histidinol phosphatase-like PHP family hydrolase|uniref:histidinol phosphate phosphatase domain-containing protein n=1 Tax=Halodesulfovibrio sp. TaxID=1912772 RepID=UPI0025F3A832|nr:histidinol phosphate phosphatase domain-containing protein [Halodesulfovibrio sp.]MCT4536092.1 histidinol phosphate phosphatase domain-containing protein [Halodesulfovibrio sp.]